MRWWWVPDTVPLALFFTATSCQKMQHLQKGMHPFFSLVQFTAANIEFYLIGEKVQQISTGSIKRMIKLLRFLTYRMKAAAREFEPWPVEIRFCKEASLLCMWYFLPCPILSKFITAFQELATYNFAPNSQVSLR
ncbi:uncharacterized protein LOC126632193 isoform X6 [Malus sylvestris]|uniref:uncharacterized protein LOC126611104 isoform X2 n=1 Tax=Malus sylvestris TaxID=3752 RepID=UPI0021AC1F7F|nr:uncharacterized protein LOC126611104 isoform X2 [Malus sylvestris]XP_050158437.1 uncharacterized protein LOC126632193 isoform X6 [Malus sylvestris]